MGLTIRKNVNSSNKCNGFIIKFLFLRYLKEYLKWCFKAKSFSWSIIQTIHYHLHMIICYCFKAHRFWEILTNKAIGIFIQPPLPRVVRVSKIDRCFQAV